MMNKSQFIENLINGRYPAAHNKEEYHQLDGTLFSPNDNTECPIINNTKNFYDECSCMRYQDGKFTRQRCEKLIAMKKVFQEKGYKGFSKREEVTASNIIGNTPSLESTSNYSSEALLSGFKPSERLQHAVEVASKDEWKLRSLLMADLNNNSLDIQHLLQTILYAQQHAPIIFESYTVGKFHPDINENSSDWSFEYFMQSQSYLNANFALERLLHLYNVRDYLAKQGDANFEPIMLSNSLSSSSIQEENSTSNHPSSTLPLKRQLEQSDNAVLKKIALVGGAILAAIGVLFLLMRG